MYRIFRMFMVVAVLVALLPALPVAAGQPLSPVTAMLPPPLDVCLNGIQTSGALYAICLPQPPVTPAWNGDLVLFAHGYVSPLEPPGAFVSQLELSDGSTLPQLVVGLGYAFATTSYSKNGLAVKEGLADVIDLVHVFTAQTGLTPNHVYLIGASEGGLITTLAAEQSSLISGGLALCGPIGSFQGQINYWGNFRVLFDYFYRQALPSSPVRIPPGVMVNWEHLYVPRIAGLVGNPGNLDTTAQLLKTSLAFNPSLVPFVENDPLAVISTTVGILSYNVFATNEAQVELGGQPFDNTQTVYSGSLDDVALNGPRGVQRFAADPGALLEISRYYETSGELKVPLVTMHTLGDPIVPYGHEALYFDKILNHPESASKYFHFPVNRYGHCTFTTQEAMTAFGKLVRMVNPMP